MMELERSDFDTKVLVSSQAWVFWLDFCYWGIRSTQQRF